MPVLEIEILNCLYKVACDTGEEVKLQELARKLDDKLKILASKSPGINDNKLLVIAALMLEDRVADLENEKLMTQLPQQKISTSSEEAVARTLKAVTDYVENLAIKVEKM
jgi:cell division protein ZapA